MYFVLFFSNYMNQRMYVLCMFIFVNILPISSSVDIFSHIGGLVSGFCVGATLIGLVSGTHDKDAIRLGYIGAICSFAYFTVTISLLFILH